MIHANTENALVVYKRLLSYVKKYKSAFILGIIGTILYSSVDAGITYFIKPALDEGFIAQDENFIRVLPFLLAAIFLIRGLASFVSTYFITWVGRTIVMEFRQQLFAQMMRLPASFYDDQTSGALLSALIYNVEQLAQASTDAFITLIREGVFVIGLLTVMLIVSWQLTLLFLLTAPFIAVIMKYASRKTRKLSKSVQTLMGNITHIAEEGIEGYRAIRIYGGEQYEINKFNAETANNRKREMHVTALNGLISPLVQLIAGAVIILMIYLASSQITGITPGGFAAIIVAMLLLLKPIKSLTTVNASIQRGIAAADSIFVLLDADCETDTGQKTLQRANGELTFSNISFTYEKSHATVLSDINVTIKPGETVALVGRSGSGKSTLISLLPRFYDYYNGTILLDGNNIKDIKLADLRKQISLVSQNVILFNDTISHNIAYGRLAAVSEADIIKAAKAAHAYDFIQALPEGLQTQIGEKGLRLSGGQRQRIAIARAILKDAPILILDEATSSLDTEAERAIQAGLEELMRERTTLVIAHRLSTIEKADKILVLDNGKIVEQGTHAELLGNNAQYAKLYHMQFNQEHVE